MASWLWILDHHGEPSWILELGYRRLSAQLLGSVRSFNLQGWPCGRASDCLGELASCRVLGGDDQMGDQGKAI